MATDHRLLPVRTLEFQTERTDSAVSTMADVGQNRKQNNANPSRSDALMVGSGSTSSSSSTTLSLPDSRAVLDAMSHVLRSAESELQQLERDNILGTAVIRACGEVADLVAHLALQLEDQTDLERRHFAAACLQDFQSSSSQDSLRLMNAEEGSLDELSRPIENATTSTALVVDSGGSNSISNSNNFMTEDDVVGIMGKVATLLRDVEFSLRSIDADDAADLADTALIVAQLALTALQNVHQQLVSHVLQQSSAEEAEWNASSGRAMHGGTGSGRSDFASNKWKGSPNIVLLDEDEDRDDDEATSRSPHDTNASTEPSSGVDWNYPNIIGS
jgi:hypothetical protein